MLKTHIHLLHCDNLVEKNGKTRREVGFTIRAIEAFHVYKNSNGQEFAC